jgi:hypothetical protein
LTINCLVTIEGLPRQERYGAPGITIYLQNGGVLEKAQMMAAQDHQAL